jgi:hypothetical protein
MKEASLIINEIKDQSYAVLPFDYPHFKMKAVTDSFLNFLKLPQDIKDNLHDQIDLTRPGSDIGYVGRDKKSGDLDNKEFFHFNDYFDLRFLNNPLTKLPEVEELLDTLRPLYSYTKDHIKNTLKTLDTGYPNLSARFIDPNIPPFYYLRVLAYKNQGEGHIIATDHYDRGVLTYAMYESTPGLKIGENNLDLKEAKYLPNSILLFRALEEIPEIGDDLRPAWHGASQKQVTPLNEQYSRTAIVCFIDPITPLTVTSKQTHTPIYY